jgi:type II secretory pathway pseudopilin PulG
MRLSRPPAPTAARRTQGGLMLVGVLILMLFSAVVAMTAADVWATTRQREREAELLFIGHQYQQAIRHYYYAAPGSRVLPTKLEDLLLDERFPVPMQHLRRLYRDPVSNSTEWGMTLRGNGIAGVYSLSEATPLKQTGFDKTDASFENRTAYRDWAFTFVPPVATGRRLTSPTQR